MQFFVRGVNMKPAKSHPWRNNQMLRLSAASSIVEKITGEKPHQATLYRWAKTGISGVKLQTRWAGGAMRTTEEWIREFFDAVTEQRTGEPVGNESEEEQGCRCGKTQEGFCEDCLDTATRHRKRIE